MSFDSNIRTNNQPTQTEAELTSVEVATQVENPTGVNYQSAARYSAEQDSSVDFEAKALEGLERGYTRLPNSVLMKLVGGEFTRNEIRIALVIARFTISFRRELAPLSKTVLMRQSGLSGAAVLEAVSGLVAKGLVRKHKGDQYRPNQLGLVLPKDWERPGSDETSGSPSVKTPTHPEVEKPTPSPVEKPTAGAVENSTHFKDIKIYKTSLSELPENLQRYFQELKPAKKRESEWRAFESLRGEYETCDVAECLDVLVTRGVRLGKSGHFQPCHSPMAYLAKAMGAVLGEITKARKVASSPQASQRQEPAQNPVDQAQEQHQLRLVEDAFQTAFPSMHEQQQIIGDICRQMPFRPSPPLARIFAMSQWWNLNHGQVASA